MSIGSESIDTGYDISAVLRVDQVPVRAGPLPRERSVVWIVDDEESITTMIGRMVDTLGFEPRPFRCGQDFLAAYDPGASECLITDVTLPGMTGLDLLRHLREQNCMLATILVTGYGSIPMCVEAMKIGAFDFLQKPFKSLELQEVVKRAIEVDRQTRHGKEQVAEIRARLVTLSAEERSTLQLILDGNMNKNIAATLDVSRRTVQYRISSLLEKMGVRSRGHLISLVTTAHLASSAKR
jgi:FixJ family two-component response regulator